MNNRHVEFWQVIIGSSLRYFIFAGTAYLLFYGCKRKAWIPFKIQRHFPKISSIRTELAYSVSTILIFAGVIYGVMFSPLAKYTLLYTDINLYSGMYFLLSFGLVIIFHDTYFYWIHRLMHWRKIFPFVHHVHHLSHNPTPLAAFSFHPLEALLEIGILPLIAFTFPVHKLVIGVFSLYMIVMNVVGHLGFEFLPEGFIKNRFSRFFNTSTHHNMHHHYGKSNYGLYFNIWDRLMKTNHTQYEAEFTAVARRARAKIAQSAPAVDTIKAVVD